MAEALVRQPAVGRLLKVRAQLGFPPDFLLKMEALLAPLVKLTGDVLPHDFLVVACVGFVLVEMDRFVHQVWVHFVLVQLLEHLSCPGSHRGVHLSETTRFCALVVEDSLKWRPL